MGFSMIGNLSSGYVIGLTPEGSEVCHRMLNSDVLGEEIDNVDENLLRHLRIGGFFSNEANPDQIYTAYFHITQNCNLDCVGCYSFDSNRNECEDTPYEIIVRILDQLAAHGIRRLIFSGGEPFLREDLPQILEYAKKVCCFERIDIPTNGTCVTQEVLCQIATNVDMISVSIDGYSENSIAYIRRNQRFNDLIRVIEMIRKTGIQVRILPTIHAMNYADIEKYQILADQLGVAIGFSLFYAPPDYPEVKKLIPGEYELAELSSIVCQTSKGGSVVFEDVPIAAALIARSSCGAGRGIISVSYDGQVYPCHMLHNEQFSMGSILEKDLDCILAGAKRKAFLDSCAALPEECLDCDLLYLCGSGCRARAMYALGSIHSKDPYCSLIRAYYETYFERVLTKA